MGNITYMNDEKIFYSLIIPIYNLEAYIKPLVTMIKKQTYTNFECLLVNDGSTDGSEKLLLDYIRGDIRFKVFSQQNMGVSAARSFGLERAVGEYIFFIDGDDYIAENCLAICHAIIIQQEMPDILNIGIKLLDKDQKLLKVVYPSLEHTLIQRFMKAEMISASLCCKIIKRNLILDNNIIIPSGIIMNEDLFASFQLFYFAKTVVNTNDVFYYYIQRSDSCTKSHTAKHISSMLRVNELLYDFSKNNKINIKELIEYRKFKIYSLYVTDYSLFNPDVFRAHIDKTMLVRNKAYIGKIEYLYFKMILLRFDFFCEAICRIQPKLRKLLKY